MYVVPNDICKLINGPEVHEPSMLCIRGPEGDTGIMGLEGPLTCMENGRWVLRGLGGPSRAVARASSQSRDERYSVYYRVSHHVDRINDIIAPHAAPGVLQLRNDSLSLSITIIVPHFLPLSIFAHHLLSVSITSYHCPTAPISINRL